ncbi:MAG: hypothetical protein HND47_08245 [Chloroflexi bacterium]|nr:hypothetical protein [Chloroflexota bacterium]
MKPKTIITLLLIAAVLVSCQTVATPHANLTETPISTPILFTETTEPTITATPLQIPSPTALPLDVNVFIEQSVVSPSGKWLALVTMTRVDNGIENSDRFILVVVNQQNFAEHIVEKRCSTRNGVLHSLVLAWSENEDYLYYTHRFGGGDGCFGEDDFFGTDLYRFNLDSGQSAQLTPKLGYWLALSPDQTMVAFLTKTDTLKIRNIETGNEQEISIDEQTKKYPDSILTHASHLIWSPDSKELLLTLEVNVCVMEEDAKHSIIKVDAETLSQKVLVLEDPNRPITLEWANSGLVLVQDESSLYWWLNPVDGQMTERK